MVDNFNEYIAKEEHKNKINSMIVERFNNLSNEQKERIVDYIISLSKIDKDGKVESKYNKLITLLGSYAYRYGIEILDQEKGEEYYYSILDDKYLVRIIYSHVDVIENISQVTPHVIYENTVSVHEPNGELIAETNNILIINDMLIQIRRKRLNGYYIMSSENVRYDIDEDGRIIGGKDLFNVYDEQLKELCGF